MAVRGRKGRYETWVKPRFHDIKKWLDEGATEKQVANKLNIKYSTWNKYKTEHEEFKALCNSPREKLIADLKGALVKKALGFTYEEKKQVMREDSESGKSVLVTEIYTKYQPPDTVAIFGALNEYDKNYIKDRANYDLKKQELALREKIADKNAF